jgi:hypothetical protein
MRALVTREYWSRVNSSVKRPIMKREGTWYSDDVRKRWWEKGFPVVEVGRSQQLTTPSSRPSGSYSSKSTASAPG